VKIEDTFQIQKKNRVKDKQQSPFQQVTVNDMDKLNSRARSPSPIESAKKDSHNISKATYNGETDLLFAYVMAVDSTEMKTDMERVI
jgi:hypothetical protein